MTSEGLKKLLEDLDRPLEDIEWNRKPIQTPQGDSPRNLLGLIRKERLRRRELRRARKAAAAAFGVKPRRSARKRAAAMFSVGAVGLAALSGPATGQGSSAMHHVIETTASQDANLRLPASLLQASDRLKEALIVEEGVRFTVYRDVAGYPTVGVGHLVEPGDGLRVGDRIDEDLALRFLEDDLEEAERGVRKLVGDLPLSQHEFDALLDLVFNVGIGNVSERKSPGLNAAIAERDYGEMASQLGYTRAGGKTARGLEFRSQRRAAIFQSASYADPREG